MVKPNILFMAADDMPHIGRMMSQLIKGFDLPNYRRIANLGTDFDYAYCVVPVCEPARTAVMTGMSPADTKSFDLSVGWSSLVHPRQLWLYRLKEAGYFLGTTGKIFHGYGPEPDWVYKELYDTPPFNRGPMEPGNPLEDRGGMYGNVYVNETDWYDVNRANDAIKFLNEYQEAKPFYYACGFHHPHNWWTTPVRIHDMINLDDVIIPEDWQGGFDTLPFVKQFMADGTTGFGTDPANWTPENTDFVRRTIRNFGAACLWMDEQLGRVYDALMASPHANNTIVTFYSDHGYHLADHEKWHKFTLYEQAACAPLMIKVPGQTPRKVTSPVSHMDLGATILDLCGIGVPEGFRGESLAPWINGETPEGKLVLTFWYGSVSGLFPDGKRVTVYQDASSEMFDIIADPWATTDISDTDPTFTERRSQLLRDSGDWGMLLVEQAIDTSRASNFQSFLGTNVTDARFATSFVALGDLSGKGRSPGYQKMYSQGMTENKRTKMPPHIEDFGFMGHASQETELIGNDGSNRVVMTSSSWKRVTMDLGEGDDENVDPGQNRLVVYGRSGNDILRAGNNPRNELYGGTGNDTLHGGTNIDSLYGGEGNDWIDGGGGNDYIIGGVGSDTIFGGAGNDTIVMDAGKDTATGGSGADTFVAHRTGEVLTITDITTEDVLDLTAWAPIQPVKVTQSGPHVEVTAALEKVICQNALRSTVLACIKGVATNG